MCVCVKGVGVGIGVTQFPLSPSRSGESRSGCQAWYGVPLSNLAVSNSSLVFSLPFFYLKICYFYFMDMGILLTCMPVDHWCVTPVEVRGNIRLPGAGVTNGCELPRM